MTSHATTFPKTLFAFIWQFMRPQRWQFIFLFASSFAHILEQNIMPYALKLIVDAVSQSPYSDALTPAFKSPVFLFLGAFTLMLVIFRMQHIVFIHTIPKFKASIRMKLLEYVKDHSHTYFASYFAGSIASKINDMPRAVVQIIEMIRWRILPAIWVTLAAIVILSTVSLYFSLGLLLWAMVHLSISYHFARKVDKYSLQHSEDLNDLQGHIVDILTNSSIMRLFARKSHETSYINIWQEREQNSDKRTLKAILWAHFSGDIPLLFIYSTVFYLLFIGWKTNTILPGDIVLVIFTVYNVIFLVWMMSSELPNLFNEIGVCKQALSLIDYRHDIKDADNATNLHVEKGEIVFDDVHFQYRPGKTIFSNQNIVIKTGEKVGLVGFSGSGKSTFVSLILRLYELQSGHIRIDGQDIANVKQDSLRSSIAMIPQDTTLFHRTLMENIRYGNVEASDEEVIKASKQAHCHEFILQTEYGYDSLVGERGIKLSGGQRQRIAIARAILKNAPILILDEATSSLDSVTEKYIQQSLDNLMQDRTTIVIAHRLSTLAHLDRILVFKEGEIIEDGNHQELLEKQGHYALLWKMQAGGFLPEEVS